ncbi:MAG: acyl carrier protein [Rhodocyclaceae bacterium]
MSETQRRVIQTMAEQLGLDMDTVAAQWPSGDFRGNLYLDSLDEIELVMALEDEFAIEIQDAEAEKWRTLADVVAHIENAAA